MPYPYAIIGTVIAIAVAFGVKLIGDRIIKPTPDPKERYRRYKFLNTAITLVFAAASFLVPSFELKPHVYLTFDSNYVTLTMRYIVDPL